MTQHWPSASNFYLKFIQSRRFFWAKERDSWEICSTALTSLTKYHSHRQHEVQYVAPGDFPPRLQQCGLLLWRSSRRCCGLPPAQVGPSGLGS
ncbi:unnamed protein product [Allacma fusca]|uniref:Uncharacterized protein n=1 Tax=Allacma fusca TaxID=39272 RepID=A0A8J2L0T6_9HEXA|nr:unnamed protein product [Allacma fusca]